MKKIQSVLIFVFSILIIFSCENDLEVVNAFSSEEDMAMQSMKNSEIVFTDSGLIHVKITAPEINNYPMATEPYLEFPNGFNIIFYDKTEKPETDLSAKYGIYYSQLSLWEARDSVEVINKDGKILNTEQLFWDERKKLIYSNTFVKTTSPDEIIMGEGFESNENFTLVKIKKIQGHIYLKNE